jgi:hypothetical protein
VTPKKTSSKREKSPAQQPKPAAPEKPGLYQAIDNLSRPVQLVLVLVVLFIAMAVLYPELVFQNKIFMAGDTEAAASFGAAVKQVPAGGAGMPLWNPFLFAGMPSYGSLAYIPNLYPVSALLIQIKKFLPLPKSTWLLVHSFCLGLGVFLLLRGRSVSFLISVAAGCFMMWMPNHVAVGANGHGSQSCTVAYLPFALMFWDRLWRGKGILVNGSALAILLGFQMLRAHLQISYYTYVLLGLHFLFFSIVRIRDAARGRAADGAILPAWLQRRTGGVDGPPVRTAVFGVGYLAMILAVIVVASLFLSAVLYLPVHDYSQYSIRGSAEGGGLDYNYATSWSLHPAEMITMVLPHAYGFGKDLYYGHMPFTDYPNYLGLIVFLGALAAVLLARNRFTWFLVFVAAVTTLVSFGNFFPVLYGPLFKLLPYFNKFRVPVMILIVQQLAVVLLFGIGLEAFIRADRDRLKKAAWWGLLGSVVLLFVALVSQSYWSGGFADSVASRIRLAQSAQHQLTLARTAGELLGRDLIKLSLLAVLVFGLVFLYSRRRLTTTVLVLVLALLSFIDLYLVDRHIVHPEKFRSSDRLQIVREAKSYDDYLGLDPVLAFLKKEDRPFRVLPLNFNPDRQTNPFSGDFNSNRYMNAGISSIGGYHAAKLSDYQDYLQSLGTVLSQGRFQLIDMMNVRYYITPGQLPEMPGMLEKKWQGTNESGQPRLVYENLKAMPRIFFVADYRIAAGKTALQELLTGRIDLTKTAVLPRPPAVDPVSSEGSRAEITTYNLNEIHIDAHTESACIMVLSEVFYPRWQVFVDGVEGEILRANHILRAVSLSPGDHKIVFKYDDTVFRRGVIVSLATLVVLVVTLVLATVSSMRRKSQWKHSS